MTTSTTVVHTNTLTITPSSTHTISVSPTPTQTTSSTHSVSQTPDMTPHPSPESGPALKEYIIETVNARRNKSEVCLRMDSMIVLMFTYITTDDKVHTI